ncbi:MAG: hypothetical protein ACE5F9_11345 [Phycisphaerae bacterium]
MIVHENHRYPVTRACVALGGMVAAALLCLSLWLGCDQSLMGSPSDAAAGIASLSGAQTGKMAEPAGVGSGSEGQVSEDLQPATPRITEEPPVDPPRRPAEGTAPPGPSNGEPMPPPSISGTDPPPTACMGEVRAFVRGCLEQIHGKAAACVEQIAEFFRNDQPDEAHQAAMACIEDINANTDECLDMLGQRCEACAQKMADAGVPMPVIQAFLGACGEAAERILDARREAVGAVEDAIDRGEVHRCIALIRDAAAACAGQNEQIADDCIAQIEVLLDDGQVDEAIALGRDCVRQIRMHTLGCVMEIQNHCRQCLRGLIRRCSDEALAGRLRQACASSRRQVFGSAADAIGRIRDALPGSDGGG